MKRIYICSPYRGDYEKNLAAAQDYSRQVLDRGFIPITPHMFYSSIVNDNLPEDRELGLVAGLELLKISDEVWVFSQSGISEGMATEIELADISGIPVKDGMEILF